MLMGCVINRLWILVHTLYRSAAVSSSVFVVWSFYVGLNTVGKQLVRGVFFSCLSVILLYFSPEFRMNSAVLNKVKSGCFDDLGQESDNCHLAVKLEFKGFFRQLGMEIVK